MFKFIGTIVIAAASMTLASASKAADCHVDRYEFVFQSDSEATMQAKPGVACYSRINGRSSIDSLSIGRQPEHGSAFVDGTHRWGYKSAPGYAGQDTFVVSVSGTSYRKGRSGTMPLSGQTNLDVSVQVAP